MVTKTKPRKLKYKGEYDNLMEGVGIWTSFYRVICPKYQEIGIDIQI